MKEISQYAQQYPALKHHLDTQVHEQNLLTDCKHHLDTQVHEQNLLTDYKGQDSQKYLMMSALVKHL